MIEPIEFVTSLKKLNIRFVTGVPDSLLKDVCACITEYFLPEQHIIATNEGSAVGLAIGHYLAAGRPALVYMQNSGLGNVVNPVISLADPQIYGIPMLLMIGWRGEIIENGMQLYDEPQHIKQGQITIPQLEIMGIPFRILDGNVAKIETLLDELISLALSRTGPVALVVKKQTFASFKMAKSYHEDSRLTREMAISAVIAALPDNALIVSTTGMASRELFELRKASGQGHHRDFLTLGGMGHAGQIAAGIAIARPDRKIVCIDGDGAVLMHMGGLAISADCPNLLHILINNSAYDSVGGQSSKGEVLNFAKIAKACGYGCTSLALTSEDINTNLQSMLKRRLSSFLEIKCKRGFRADLGRPDRLPAQNKKDFMCFLREGS
jgi:phosphonopyruvate decarboxylase